MPEPTPDLPLVEQQRGTAAALVAVGLASVVAQVVLSDSPWRVLLATAAGAAAGGLVGVVIGRLTFSERRLDRLPAVAGAPRRTPAAAWRSGILLGVLAAATSAVAIGIMSRLFDEQWTDAWRTGSTVWLTLGVFLWLQTRWLQRWQQRRELRVVTRTGAPRLAWTRAQAHGRLAAVPITDHPA